MAGKSIRVRRFLAAALALVLVLAFLPAAVSADNSNGLEVEKLLFRDVLRLYAVNRASFGANALETDANGVSNSAKRLAELFAGTVGLNYTGEGENYNYFGKDVTAKMGKEPYTSDALLATYSVEILPYRSGAVALAEGKTTSIRVYLAGYTSSGNGVEQVLHYVWQDGGVWYAVKDDVPFYRVSFNGRSARDTGADKVVWARSEDVNASSLSEWTSLTDAPDGDGVVHLADCTIVAGDGTADIFGVTKDLSALSSRGGLASSLTTVSDLVRGSGHGAGPLVVARSCRESTSARPVKAGEALREGVSYTFRVTYDEALARVSGSGYALQIRSEVTGRTGTISDVVWYGDTDFLTSDRYDPHTVEFTFTPAAEGKGVCTFTLSNLRGSDTAQSPAVFHTLTATSTTAPPPAAAVTLSASSEERAEAAAPAETAAPAALSAAAPVPLATSLPLLVPGGENSVVTRAELAESLWTMNGYPTAAGGVSFKDLPAQTNTRQAVIWSSLTGLISGRGDGTYRPDEALTRGETAAILRRYAAMQGMNTDPSESDDVAWAVNNGVMNAREDGSLGAGDVASAGDITRMIFRLQQKI